MITQSKIWSQLISTRKFEISDFIKAVFDAKKIISPRLTLRTFANQLNISPSMLSLVIQKKRIVSDDWIKTLILALNLSKNENELLKLFLKYSKTQDASERKILVSRILEKHNQGIAHARYRSGLTPSKTDNLAC
jgi:hypothetical protein